MTLMQYLLEYTLENVCRGNRSECARRMGMEYAELRRVRKRMSKGSVSSRATEALLEMYWREGLSVDEVLRQYTRSQFGADLEAVEQVCSELVKELRESLQDQGRNTHRSAHLIEDGLSVCGAGPALFLRRALPAVAVSGYALPCKEADGLFKLARTGAENADGGR